MGDVEGAEADAAAGNGREGEDGFEQGRLARTIGADHHRYAVLLDFESNIFDDRQAAIAGGERLHRQQRAHARASYFPPPK
jgi:hypothetical protein